MNTKNPNKEAEQLIRQLEAHSKTHHPELKLRNTLAEMLHAVRRELARDSKDAKLIVRTYTRSLREEVIAQELQEANAAVKRLLRSLGIMTVSLLPLSFITLPGLFALARYFNIELIPDEKTRHPNNYKT